MNESIPKNMEKLFVAYYRVSTKKQGDSGLGLEAQRASVMTYIKNNGNRLIADFVECESGKNDKRPELLKAIAMAKKTDSTLCIAKLDRLSRKLSFISQLLDEELKFVCCDFPEANKMIIGVMAVLAEWEHKQIVERTKSALKAKRVREPLWKPGSPKVNLTDEDRQRGYVTMRNNSINNEATRKASHYISLLLDQGKTYAEIADLLNAENYRTRLDKLFTVNTVFNTIRKYKNKLESKTSC